MESKRMPAGTICPECGYLNKQPRTRCKNCKRAFSEIDWENQAEDESQTQALSLAHRRQILEEAVSKREKSGFRVVDKTDTSVRLFKPKVTTNDILIRAAIAGIILFIIFSGASSNERTNRIAATLGPGGAIVVALLYVGAPYVLKKDQAIKISVDDLGAIQVKDIDDIGADDLRKNVNRNRLEQTHHEPELEDQPVRHGSETITCPGCGQQNGPQRTRCFECGWKLKSDYGE